GGSAPVADPYVANASALLSAAGLKPNERLIKAEEALTRALSFEVAATLGPGAWLALMGELQAGAVTLAPVANRGRGKRQKKAEPAVEDESKSKAPPASKPNQADTIDRWMADALEATEDGTGYIYSKELRKLCEAWCEARKVDMPDENELWARMRESFKHDKN